MKILHFAVLVSLMGLDGSANLYTISPSAKLHQSTYTVVANPDQDTYIDFKCTAYPNHSSLEWYINGSLLSNDDLSSGVMTDGPYVDSDRREATISIPINGTKYNHATIKCGALTNGSYSQALTLALIQKPPLLIEGTLKLLSCNMIRFSWAGQNEDFIEYYIVEIQDQTSVILKLNTTDNKADIPVTACNVTYKFFVIPVNIAGQGRMFNVSKQVTCPPVKGIQATPASASNSFMSQTMEALVMISLSLTVLYITIP